VNPFCPVMVIATGAVVPPTCVEVDEGVTLIVKSPAGGGADEDPPQDTREHDATAAKTSMVRFKLSSKRPSK